MTIRVTPWNLEFYGDSSETKPTKYKRMTGEEVDIPNASTLYFTDTSELFMWNALKSKWDKQ